MTLALSLGMAIGVRRTLWMMIGELTGVALVVLATLAGVATVMLTYPDLFIAFKLLGSAYLAFLGIQLWQSRGAMAIRQNPLMSDSKSRTQLVIQGFVTAVVIQKVGILYCSSSTFYRLPTITRVPDHYFVNIDFDLRIHLSDRLCIWWQSTE